MDPRPLHLNLFVIKFPITAIVSILHRISGVVLFLVIPGILWSLQHSLSSRAEFDRMLASPLYCVGVAITGVALLYHAIAGIRHLIMDLGIGESFQIGKMTALAVLIVSVVMILLLGLLYYG